MGSTSEQFNNLETKALFSSSNSLLALLTPSYINIEKAVCMTLTLERFNSNINKIFPIWKIANEKFNVLVKLNI